MIEIRLKNDIKRISDSFDEKIKALEKAKEKAIDDAWRFAIVAGTLKQDLEYKNI